MVKDFVEKNKRWTGYGDQAENLGRLRIDFPLLKCSIRIFITILYRCLYRKRDYQLILFTLLVQEKCKTAIFYSITSTQMGLQGIELGTHLIKQASRHDDYAVQI